MTAIKGTQKDLDALLEKRGLTVGSYVYKVGASSRIGKILKVKKTYQKELKLWRAHLLIEWATKEPESPQWVYSIAVSSMESLMEKHERALRRHRKNLAEARGRIASRK